MFVVKFVIDLIVFLGSLVVYILRTSYAFFQTNLKSLSKVNIKFPKFKFIKAFKLPDFKKLSLFSIWNSKDRKKSKKKQTKKQKKISKTVAEKDLTLERSSLPLHKRFISFFFIPKGIRLFLSGVITAVLLFVIPFGVYSWYRELPRPELLGEGVVRCTKILDRKLRLLYEVCPEDRATPVSLNQVPKTMIDATLAIEDASFYSHMGFRPLSILRAARETLLNKNVQGGSTITQQLVKLSLLSPERTISRKIKELALSLMVEKKYSKDEILELYLNYAPYGGNIVGVGTASQKFYGKNVEDLNLAEASMLAGLPSAPSIYSPFVSFELAKERQKLVLNRMVELNYITSEEADKAYNEELSFIPQKDFIRAPHFVDYIRMELERMYGKRYASFGGLTVVTTLDLDIQDNAQKIIKEEVDKASYLNISNGSSVVLDARNGEILAMVGSTDYFNKENDGVFNAAISSRQPGSTIKVVTYTLGLMRGYKASSVVSDNPTVINNGYEVYKPENYDKKYHGMVTFRRALANSYNIAAVNILRSLNINEMVNLGKDMGLTQWEADGNYGLSITLGGKETNLLALTNVYGTLARGGKYTTTKPFISITDSKGYSIYKPEKFEKRVVPEEVAYIMTDILSDYYARLPAFGVNNYLSVPGHTVAVKTGTTDYKKDNYTVGYTPSYVVGVWVGNNDNTPMNPNLASGLTGAAPAWNRIMASLLIERVNEVFPVPENVVVKVYPECGNLREVFIKGTEPKSMSCGVKPKSDKKEENKKKKD